jgi:hypothetical protein
LTTFWTQLVVAVAIVGHEKDVIARVGHLAKGRDHGRDVAVADIVLLAVGPVGAVGLGASGSSRWSRCRRRGPLREAKGKDPPSAGVGRPAASALRWRSSRWAQAQDGDLPGVPVVQPVEGQDLVELAVAPGVPAAAGVAVGGGSAGWQRASPGAGTPGNRRTTPGRGRPL